MIVVINDTLGAYGGTHTLTVRMCQWLTQNGYRTAVFCESDNNKQIVDMLRRNGTAICKIDTSETDATSVLVHSLMEDDDIKIISYMWEKYLDLEIVKSRKKMQFENILYCVHYGTFMRGSTYPLGVKQIVKRKYFRFFSDMVSNNSIVMMDEDTTKKTMSWFGRELTIRTPYIRIPMICQSQDDYEEIIKKGFKSNIIMSASRAEFPYKGYQIGLIKEMPVIKEMCPKARLVMIAGGEPEDVQRMLDEINALPRPIQKDVELHNWMDYNSLKTRMKDCKVFIGMGTSVLDAGLLYKPAIPVKYNTYAVEATCLLSEKPEWIGAPEECDKSATELLSRILTMDESTYRQEAIRTRTAIEGCYDIEKNLRTLLRVQPVDNKSILRSFDIRFIQLLGLAGRVKHRQDSLFDVKRINKED